MVNSDIENCGCLSCYSNCREENNLLQYYYINEDGVRLTIFDYSFFPKIEDIQEMLSISLEKKFKKIYQKSDIPSLCLSIMAFNHYGIQNCLKHKFFADFD